MRSMTGCGTGRIQRNGWEVTVELKTVNHRFLDLSMRLPRNISFLEPLMRSILSEDLKRGHVDIYITVRNTESSSVNISLDPDLAAQYWKAGEEMSAGTGAENDLTVSRLMSMEGVITLTEKEMDEETVAALCTEAAEIALKQLVSMRENEGANLKADILNHLEKVSVLREAIQERAPNVVSEYRKKLENRIGSLLAEQVDPQRLAQEVALMADRCAIDEELIRLNSHVLQMRQYLEAEGETGKKMDFLIQEMNREANTIGSKAQDGEIARRIVDLKSEIEKLREQIQNVE